MALSFANFGQVDKLFKDAELAWSDHFAEQRTNILLVTGKHFQKRAEQYWERQRQSGQVSESQKVRFTKNHIQVVTKAYVNSLITACPGVRPFPKNENELRDKKAAELAWAVADDVKRRLRLREETRRDAHNFIELGEVAVKVFWDPNKGRLIHEQVEQSIDEDGKIIEKKTPVFTGDIVVERILGFNLLIDPAAKSWADARYVFLRKLVDIDEVKSYIGDNKEAADKLTQASADTYRVFDVTKSGYDKVQNKTELRECYVRPCTKYPKGMYIFMTPQGELVRGELPGGIWPIEYKECDEIETTPRGASIIRPLRPLQGEINRASGKRIEHMLSVGDDKLITVGNSTMTQGASFAGIRHFKVNGNAPTFLSGRTGDQYAEYISSTISELYQLAQVGELDKEGPTPTDPMQQVYMAMRKKKRFALYHEKFAEFQAAKLELIIRVCKEFMPDEMVVAAIGRPEAINIAEFRSIDDLLYQIKTEEVDDDIDTMWGKQMMLGQLVQYIGPQLDKSDIGKIIRTMPFLNQEEGLQEFAQDYDNAVNDLLALDRGEWVEPDQDDNHDYIISKLTNRMKKADFKFLAPEIQEMYRQKRSLHQTAKVEQLRRIKAAQSEFIPTGGFMVACDFYVPTGPDPSKTARVRVPSEAINWLIETLKAQGSELEKLERQHQGPVAEMADQFVQQQQPGDLAPSGPHETAQTMAPEMWSAMAGEGVPN